MEELRSLYRNALPARIESLRQGVAAMEAGDGAAEAAVRRVAHTLRGSGGTYGFPEISAAAASAEDASRGDLPDRVNHLIALLLAALRDA